jgi:hypothetical protein
LTPAAVAVAGWQHVHVRQQVNPFGGGGSWYRSADVTTSSAIAAAATDATALRREMPQSLYLQGQGIDLKEETSNTFDTNRSQR